MNDVTIIEFFKHLTVGQVATFITVFAVGSLIATVAFTALSMWSMRRFWR
jgi:hypothetical protein